MQFERLHPPFEHVFVLKLTQLNPRGEVPKAVDEIAAKIEFPPVFSPVQNALFHWIPACSEFNSRPLH